MRRLPGQALRHCWTVLHRLLAILVAIAVVLSLGVAALAWRLSRGPIDMPWLAQRIEAAVNPVGASRLQVGSAGLAWEGFHAGLNSPLDIRLTGIELRRPDGSVQLAVPRAELTLSVTALLRGRLAPRTLEVEQPSVTAQRTADGAFRFTVGGDAHTRPAPTQLPASYRPRRHLRRAGAPARQRYEPRTRQRAEPGPPAPHPGCQPRAA